METSRVNKTGIIEKVQRDDEECAVLLIADEQEGVGARLYVPRAEVVDPGLVGQLREGVRIKFQLVDGTRTEKLEIEG